MQTKALSIIYLKSSKENSKDESKKTLNANLNRDLVSNEWKKFENLSRAQTLFSDLFFLRTHSGDQIRAV